MFRERIVQLAGESKPPVHIALIAGLGVCCNMTWLIAFPTVPGFSVVGENILTQDSEMRFVRCNSQHDQVGIQSVNYMSV